METVYISWTIQNWITVCLMVFIAVFIVNMCAAVYDKLTGG